MNWLQKIISNLIPTQRRLPSFYERHAPQPRSRVPEMADVIDALRAAEAGDTQPLFALYRDVVIDDLDVRIMIETRKLAILGDDHVVTPYDDTIPADVDAAKRIEDMIAECDSWFQGLNYLLDGSLWPLAMVEKVFSPAPSGSGQRFRLQGLYRVNPQLFDFTQCALRLACVNDRGERESRFFVPDSARYITHRGHLLTHPDNWGGPLRSLLFWSLLANCDVDWWGRFLEKYGAPFPVGYYEANDDDSKSTLERAFALATRIGGLVVTQDTRVELVQAASSSSGEGFDRFHDLCRKQIAKGILGQTMTSESQAQGIGGTQANIHERIRQDIRQWDAKIMSQTLRMQLFRQYLLINGWEGRPPHISWGVTESDENEFSTELLKALPHAGLRVTDEGINMLSKKFGVPLERTESASPMPPGFDLANLRRAGQLLTGEDERLAVFAAARRLSPHLLEAALAEIVIQSRASVARGLRNSLADVPRLLRDSHSPRQFQDALLTLLRSEKLEAPTLLTNALISAAANGSAASR